MFCTKCFCACLVLIFTFIFSITAKVKSPLSFSPWSAYKGQSGAPITPGMDTITVPYIGKSSPFFPKFVNPKTMISKKTDLLSNLFGGFGAVSYPMSSDNDFFSFGPSQSGVYARSIETEPTQQISQLKGILGRDNNDENQVKNEFKRGVFGPVSSSFGPMGPKFGLMNPFTSSSSHLLSNYGLPVYGFNPMPASVSRKKRSTVPSVTSSPSSYRLLPSYSGLTSIPEESRSPSRTLNPSPYLSGPFGPYETFSPVSVVDPSVFIAKKTAFLNALFSSLVTSTPTTITDLPTMKSTIVPPGFWSPFETTTEVPVVKSTIVPPGFWLPSSVIPTPGEYTNKVATFLDKLFESIKLNKTQMAPYLIISSNKIARSLELNQDDVNVPVKQSIEDLKTLVAAKDAIVDTIITELGSLKTEMINNMNDFIMSQTMTSISKKPIKPMKAAFAGLWTPMPDYSLPFRQKMAVFSQVFDTLTELQKNITIAVTDAIKNKTVSTEYPVFDNSLVNYQIPSHYLFNVTLFDAVKGKMTNLNSPQMDYQSPLPFRMTYTKSTAKKDISSNYKDDIFENSSDDKNQQYKRAVKMSIHQNYESMPPGTIESIQTGGGSVPGHQGGGIKFLDFQNNDYDGWNGWLNYFNNQYKDDRHHHNHLKNNY